jgi:hypothetical protein
MNTTQTETITSEDLRAQGFTAAQIERLELLQASYDPYREYFESNREFERLAFLKWRYQQGQVEGVPASRAA